MLTEPDVAWTLHNALDAHGSGAQAARADKARPDAPNLAMALRADPGHGRQFTIYDPPDTRKSPWG